MTLPEVKNKVAFDNGFKSWKDWKQTSLDIVGRSSVPEGWHDKVAEIYADERISEVMQAINEQIEKSQIELNDAIFGSKEKNEIRMFIAGLRKAKHLIYGL